MSAREKAIAAVEARLLDAALSHADRARKLVAAIEEAGVVLAAPGVVLDRDGDAWHEVHPDHWHVDVYAHRCPGPQCRGGEKWIDLADEYGPLRVAAPIEVPS